MSVHLRKHQFHLTSSFIHSRRIMLFVNVYANVDFEILSSEREIIK